MNIVLNLTVVAASVIGAGMAFPQALRLFTTRSTDGISPMWIGVSLAINTWWTAYAIAASVAVLLPVSIASFMLYASMAAMFIHTERSAGHSLLALARPMAAGAFGLGLAPLPALLLGGWEVAGVAIGLCYGLQLLPAVAAAYRTRLLAGVSNGTWILSFVEGVLWLMYGWMIRDAALAAGGAAGVVMSGVILARLELTGHEPFVVPFPRRAAYAR